jgi:hypothetical protein
MRIAQISVAALMLVVFIGITDPAFSETKKETQANQTSAPKSVLILVKEFSMENTEVEDLSGEKAEKVIAEKQKRLPSVLSQKLLNRLLRNGFAAASFNSNSTTTTAAEVFILDGEFVRIHKSQPRMSVRVWVYRPDDPANRLIQSDIGARSTAGPVAIGSVAMNNLAHNVIQYLQAALPLALAETKSSETPNELPQ